jgi:hypothetical protein
LLQIRPTHPDLNRQPLLRGHRRQTRRVAQMYADDVEVWQPPAPARQADQRADAHRDASTPQVRYEVLERLRSTTGGAAAPRAARHHPSGEEILIPA